jgi:hypothetical protein
LALDLGARRNAVCLWDFLGVSPPSWATDVRACLT